MSNLNDLKVYFFSGSRYIRVTRGETGGGSVDADYNPPAPISNWQWPSFPDGTAFGANGIDAALYSGSKCYFFKGPWYVRVTRNGTVNAGQQDFPAPRPISDWGWPKLANGQIFGANGIDAALWSGPVCYFFSGNQYIRVPRGDDDFGKADPGYPNSIEGGWGWPQPFANSVKGALPSGLKCYFFLGPEYIRVSRGLELAAGFGVNGIDAALYSGAGGDALRGVTATINIDEDFISTTNGFGFQLNTFSKYIPGTTKAVAQQLIIYSNAGTTDLNSWIFTYAGSFEDGTAKAGFINISKSLATLPAKNTLKAGSSLKFTPIIDPSSGNLLGCTYTYTPAGGSAVSNQLLNTDSIVSTTGQKATTADLSPIITFTMDIVAQYNSEAATLSIGQGSISYTSSTAAGPQPLTATTFAPSYSNFNGTTQESANIIYAGLPGNRPIDVSQLFGTTPPVPVDTDIVAKTPSVQGMGLPRPPRLGPEQNDEQPQPQRGFGLPVPPRLARGTYPS
ncbi:hypothetical protein MMC17_006295 [Xylographa soralifera]|nr:hypothetical protein [Xylographa soralifera]